MTPFYIGASDRRHRGGEEERAVTPTLSTPSGALISECGQYRYLLWRRQAITRSTHLLGFIMLNPSTADASKDDATIRRCLGFAHNLGYAGILVANVFAWRATDPHDLHPEDAVAIGPDNDAALQLVGEVCPVVIAAWGAHKRAGLLVDRVARLVGRLHCLDTTKSGAPRHPLYLRSYLTPKSWTP